MRFAALAIVLLTIVVSSAHADVGVYSNPNVGVVTGIYKTLRKAKHVRRQITPGGNLVRAVFRGGACAVVSDPYADSWSCDATIAEKFRAQGQVAVSETWVSYEWSAEQQKLTVTSDATVASFGSGNDFAVGVDVHQGAQSFTAAVGVEEVVPGSWCRAFYAMSATSDVSPVRVFNVPTRRGAVSRIPCAQ